MVLLNFKVVYNIISLHARCFSVLHCRMIHEALFLFSIQTQMTRPDKLEFNFYCESYQHSLSHAIFFTPNLRVFSSILIPFPFFVSPPHFVQWLGSILEGVVPHRGNLLVFHVIEMEWKGYQEI